MKISVALCTYNGAKYVKEQLQSIVVQQCPVNEIIICDDHSEDETLALVEEFMVQWPSIDWQVHRNEKALGSIRNFEKAITCCKGDLVFLSDQDDRWMPDKVGKHIAFYQSNQKMAACFSDGSLVNEQGHLLPGSLFQSHWFSGEEKFSNDPSLLYEYLLLAGNIVTGATLSFKKEAVEYILPFRQFAYGQHDYYISLLLSAMGKIGFLPDHLIQYRIHRGQQIGVPALSGWKVSGEFKKKLSERNFSATNADSFLSVFWNAYKMDKEIQTMLPGGTLKPDFSREIRQLKTLHLSNISFSRRARLLFGWWRRGLYFVTTRQMLSVQKSF